MNTIMGYDASAVVEAERVQEQLAQLDYDEHTPDDAVECVRGMSRAAFTFLDEKQGWFGKSAYCDGFTLLRQARNDPSLTKVDVLDVLR